MRFLVSHWRGFALLLGCAVFHSSAPAKAQVPNRLVPPPGCWTGTVQAEDSARLVGPFPLGNWSPDTRRICFMRANGSYGLRSERIDTSSPLATGLREQSALGPVGCGTLSLLARGDYADVGSPVGYALQVRCTQADTGQPLLCQAQGTFYQQGSLWYYDTWHATFSAAGGPHLERCFGGIGNGCQGGGNFLSNLAAAPGRRNADGSYSLDVSVGSILHDNCCLRNPDGYFCGGRNRTDMCHAEWDKAVNNSLNHRAWPGRFGPYFCGNSEDDLSPAAGRPAGLGGVMRTPPETLATRSLMAPAGTAMDTTDAAFCASGRLAPTLSGATWSVCQ